jgi:hypothetical protein
LCGAFTKIIHNLDGGVNGIVHCRRHISYGVRSFENAQIHGGECVLHWISPRKEQTTISSEWIHKCASGGIEEAAIGNVGVCKTGAKHRIQEEIVIQVIGHTWYLLGSGQHYI